MDLKKQDEAAYATKLDSGKDNLDVAASVSSAIPAIKLDLESQQNEASTSKFEKIDRDMSVHTGGTTNSEMRNGAINDGDKISVDRQDVGVDDLTVAELRRQLKVWPNIRLKHEVGRDVVMRNENTELQGQLALKEVMNAVPTWQCCLPTVKDREASGYFDRKSFDSFHTLDQSIRGVIRKKGMPDWMITELEKLCDICEAASSIHLSRGWYDRDKIDNQITTIEDFAKVLTHDYELGMSLTHGANSKIDVLGERDVASPSRGGQSG
ncbi:hypothetical protein V502_00855 [Pseudogymnoascus sp. VKM F-4520 (FW-2644)]|nr:hypothetical protein V502_00855 [Pseudogymnoascus sp. VKM F-4520 (FW-2644)]